MNDIGHRVTNPILGRLLLNACLNFLNSHLLQLTRAHHLPISVFALGIVAQSPQPTVGGEDLQRIARPAGERPNN